MERMEVIKKYICTPSSIAIIGASPKENRPVYGVMNYLQKIGHTLYPVNPAYKGKEILGIPCFDSLSEIPDSIDVVAFFLSPSLQQPVAEELVKNKKIHPIVWFQPGAENPTVELWLEERGFFVVSHECMMVAHRKWCF
ncbi:MAG: CoA-binding protein [Aminobacterium sp.]